MASVRRLARRIRRRGAIDRGLTRAMDIVAGTIGLALVSPLLLVCAGWILLVDGGPVLYRQWRVGEDGWLFCIYKLRTMRRDAERAGPQFAAKGDPRVIPGGAWMRRCHIDELPQLVNILMGEMSLVGPRPERPEMHERLREQMPRIDLRLRARPGLTGLAQVRNGYTNDARGSRRKLAWDLRYLRRRRFTEDLRLVIATIPKVWDHGAL
jgi:lipopolysaccharide/colanic/teichoic acid biosynthesis glycosyltransferase